MAAHDAPSRSQLSGLGNQPTGLVKKFNVDLVAVAIALTLAALIRLNIIPHVGF